MIHSLMSTENRSLKRIYIEHKINTHEPMFCYWENNTNCSKTERCVCDCAADLQAFVFVHCLTAAFDIRAMHATNMHASTQMARNARALGYGVVNASRTRPRRITDAFRYVRVRVCVCSFELISRSVRSKRATRERERECCYVECAVVKLCNAQQCTRQTLCVRCIIVGISSVQTLTHTRTLIWCTCAS